MEEKAKKLTEEMLEGVSGGRNTTKWSPSGPLETGVTAQGPHYFPVAISFSVPLPESVVDANPNGYAPGDPID